MGFVEEAAQEGYTQEEINGFLATKHQEAKAEGYSDEEISSYIKGDVLEQKAFNKTALASTGHANLAPMKSPTTLMEAIETGWNWSNIALGREALKGIDGRLPTMQVDESTPLALRAAANLTGTVADVPSMIAGGLIGGGPASPVTALGGAFALPMGLRSVFIDSILEGQAGTKKEFADRAIGTMWETAKGFITGAATGAVGKAATAAVSGLPAAAKAILPTAAEIATLTEVSARLEGHAPEPTALIDNAIVLGVAKTVLPSWAAVKQPNILHETYVKTGILPEQVVQDAMKGDKGVWQDTLDGRVPDAYKGQVEQKPSAATQTQRTGMLKAPSATTKAEPVAHKADVVTPNKPLWEMTSDELQTGMDVKREAVKTMEKEILGDRAEEFKRLERQVESYNLERDNPDKYRQVTARHNEILDSLTEAQQDRLYGKGETDPQVDDYKELRNAINNVYGDTPQELGQSISRAITEVGNGTDPATMSRSERVAFAQIRHAMDEAKRLGFNLKDVSEAAIRASARRFSDPQDAEFMLERFIKKPQATAKDNAPIKQISEEVRSSTPPPSQPTQTQRTQAFHGTTAPPFSEFKGTPMASFYYDPSTGTSGKVEHSAIYLTESKDLADAWSKVNPGKPRIVEASIEGDLLTVDGQGKSINQIEGLAFKQAMEQGKKGVKFTNVIDSPNDAQAVPHTVFAVLDSKNVKINEAKYQQASPLTPNAQTVPVKAMTPEQQAQAKAFMESPFAEIPQAPNEPSRPTHINYNYIDTPEQAQQALSQLSTIYESKIQEQRQSPKAWEQSHQESAKVLADLLQSDPKTVTAFLKGEKAGPSTTAQLLARKELTLRFTEELMRRRAALMAKGEKATPEELVGFLAQVERVSNVQSAFLGQRADVARALNALKSTKREADRAQAIVDAVNQYGGAENVSKLVEMLGEYDNPAQAIKFAKEATKATKWEMVVEAWKAGLVSGLRTNEVNFLSTAAFTTLRLPTEAIAATIGAIKGKEDRVAFTEIPARMLGMTAGFRDGFKAAGAVLRTGDNILGTKTDTFQPAIPGKTGEVIRLPFRVLSAADVLFKTINERSELYAMATKQAMNERAMGTQPTKQQSVTFKTSKGSTYKVESDGTTTRDKAARPEHPGDQGVQPASETTFYVDEASMNKLSEFQAKGFVKRSIEKLPDGRVGIKYMDGKDAGKFESRTIITPESTPSVGLHPVELWEAGTRAHFGNKITEVSVPSVQAGDLIGKSLFDRIADIAANPSEEMAATAKDAAMRYTFNKPLGPAGKAFQHMVRVAHLEWMFPFITTPGNIFKETARMTPGLNFAVKEWRADYEAGGVRRDKALAEVAVGTAIMSAVVAASINGTITGNGTPDKAMRSTERAAGWKPYSVKINGQYVDGYLRMAPIGPLIGIAADGAEFMKYMTGDERDQWGRMLAFAFASNVTNQTFMTGATNFVNVLQDPSRYGQNYFESLASSVIPSIVGQTAADIDPLLREIHGIRDAMIARIPGQREGLMPKRDWTGQPIASPERLWWGSPFTVSTTTTDKVRLEAARIGFATPDIPKAIDVLPGKDFGKLDKVPLTLAQRDVFASQSGQLAYATLQGIVNTPGWETQPDIIKRQVYEKVMKRSRDMATKQLLLGQDPAVTQKIVDEITKSLK